MKSRYYYFSNFFKKSLLLCYMKKGVECILVLIIAFVIYSKPNTLVKYGGSIIGKFLMLLAVIGGAFYNPLYGLLFATLMVLLLETHYEVKEGNCSGDDCPDDDTESNDDTESHDDTESDDAVKSDSDMKTDDKVELDNVEEDVNTIEPFSLLGIEEKLCRPKDSNRMFF